MRWDCDKQGCFNRVCRPKIEVFSECFPGKINFGDIDGIVEINGIGLMLEWKGPNGSLRTAQEIMYKRLTKTGLLSVLVVIGDAEKMTTEKYCWFYRGKQSTWKPGNIEKVKEQMRSWANWARGLPL